MIRPNFLPLLHQPNCILVGLMSGTSVDGIDAAVVNINGQGENITANLIAFSNTPFPDKIRKRIFKVFDPKNATSDVVGTLNMELGELYAKAVLNIIKKANFSPLQIDAIGSHGQTIFHQPNKVNGQVPFTLQIGDGNVIAQRTNIPCVSDFRTADMAAGGQGAPLVPFTEYLLYKSETKTILLQNIGGIGNVTVLPAGCCASEVYAFDTGPGNMVIDNIASKISNGKLNMDVNGELAAKGKVNNLLLSQLLAHNYFIQKPPKTTGRELFGEQYTLNVLAFAKKLALSNEDIAATVTSLTAESISLACKKFILPNINPSEIIVGGGGSYNPTLIAMLKKTMAPLNICVKTQEQLGLSSDAKEAVAFAILADCTLRGIPAALPSVTGASYPAMLGKISLPNGDITI